MQELSVVQQDELFVSYANLSPEEKINLLVAMTDPYWKQTIPRERMPRMRTNVILAIARIFAEGIKESELNARASIAITFVPELNDQDIDALESLAKTDGEAADAALYIAYHACDYNRRLYDEAEKPLPFPEKLSAEIFLRSDNKHLREGVFIYLTDNPGHRFMFDALEEYAKETELETKEQQKYDQIIAKVAKLNKPVKSEMVVPDSSPVSAERRQFIAGIADIDLGPLYEDTDDEDAWYELDEKRTEIEDFIANNNSPAELHEFVERYNFGNDKSLLKLVVNNKLCDRNTALLIFWQLQPTSFQKYEKRELANNWDLMPTWEIVRDVLSNINEGIVCKEKNMPETYKQYVSEQGDNPKWVIHDLMYGL